MVSPAQIVLNPFGSFGDLHPYMALGLELQARGHHVVIATSALYRHKIRAEGLAFAAVRPDVGDLIPHPELVQKLWHPTKGTQFLLKDYLLPQVRDAFADLRQVCRSADLLITHMASFAGPVVADALRLRWLSVALQPAALFSRHDVLVVPEAPWLRHVYRLGPWFTGLLLRAGEWRTERWAEPVHALRRELGLPPRRNPIMNDQFSPFGSLALFSRHFAPSQPDWPAKTTQPGFVFYDRSGYPEGNLVVLQRFLAGGAPPILFTLGSSAVFQAGSFFEASRKAALALGQRAMLLVGPEAATEITEQDGILTAPYLPFSTVMPYASVVVHQGGIGTVAQTLRAGKASLVVPWAHDQPDNGERLRRLGVGRVLPRRRYSASTACQALEPLLTDKRFDQRAAELGRNVREENALRLAGDAVEAALLSSAIG